MASNRLPADARSSRRFVGPTGPGGRVPALDNVFPFPCLGGLLRLIYFRRQGLRWREREKNLIFRRLTSRTKSGRWVSDMFAPALAPSRLALEAPRLRVTRPVPAASLSDGMADQITGRVRLCAHGPSRLPARARSDARAGLVVSSEQFEWQPDSKRPRAGLSEATTDMSSLQVGAATSLVAVALRAGLLVIQLAAVWRPAPRLSEPTPRQPSEIAWLQRQSPGCRRLLVWENMGINLCFWL